MRYFIIPLAIIIYILWSIKSIKNIINEEFDTGYFSYLWIIFHIVLIIVFFIKDVIPFIIEHW